MEVIKRIFFFPNNLVLSIHLLFVYWRRSPKDLPATQRMLKTIDFISQDYENINEYVLFLKQEYKISMFITSFCVWILIIKLILL
jgi:hypothetical protein